MKKQCVVQNGIVIHVGDWPRTEFIQDEMGESVLRVNPIPDGAIEAEHEVEWTADGRIVLMSNYQALRVAEYPSIGDQLDALFKAGLFPADMAELVKAVKNKYPKV
jgi:hypothetical protein